MIFNYKKVDESHPHNTVNVEDLGRLMQMIHYMPKGMGILITRDYLLSETLVD